MATSLTFISRGDCSRPLTLFLAPLGGSDGLYENWPVVRDLGAGVSRTALYPDGLGTKVLVSAERRGILEFANLIDLTGVQSCQVIVTAREEGPILVALENIVRDGVTSAA